ncbi:hypothetical protein NKI94_29165 [Mesorhizobium australicum]|uniref:hypothetical protein n=1 Tax=Mesorhizobium australicum TaxID=536018 RepID=UPI003336D9FF
MQIFDRIDSLIDADDCRAAIEEARALLFRFQQRSDALTHAIDDFLLDLITLSLLNVTDAALNFWRKRWLVEDWRRSGFCWKASIPLERNDAQSLLLTGYRAAFRHSDEGN